MSRRKLDARQFAPEILPYLLVNLCQRAAALGVPPVRLCAGLGVDLAELKRGVLVSNRQAWRMIRRALQLSGRADLGFEVGVGQDLASFGLLGQVMAVASTLDEAITLGVRFHPAGGALLDIEARSDSAGITVELRPRLRDPQVVMFLLEEFLASVLELFRRELMQPLRLQALELSYPPPAHSECYAQVLGCMPQFNAGRNAFFIHATALKQPLPKSNPALFETLKDQLEQHARQGALDTVAAVKRLLGRGAAAPQSVAQLASALDLSARTLRRRLEEADTSFRALHNQVRAEQAQALLEQGVTVAEAGRRLGFSDIRTFRRAFKRWQGQSPSEVRKPG